MSQLADVIRVSDATASRMLATLEREGFIERLPGGTFELGPELARLGRLADHNALLLERIHTFLEHLSGIVRETVTVSVKTANGSIDVIRQLQGPHFIGDHNWIGLHPPNHATSNGKIFLADLPEDQFELEVTRPLQRCAPATITSARALRTELEHVRRRGYATILDEIEEGLAGISVPVRDPDHTLLCVISVSGPRFRFDDKRREKALKALRDTAQAIQASGVLRHHARADGTPTKHPAQ